MCRHEKGRTVKERRERERERRADTTARYGPGPGLRARRRTRQMEREADDGQTDSRTQSRESTAMVPSVGRARRLGKPTHRRDRQCDRRPAELLRQGAERRTRRRATCTRDAAARTAQARLQSSRGASVATRWSQVEHAIASSCLMLSAADAHSRAAIERDAEKWRFVAAAPARALEGVWRDLGGSPDRRETGSRPEDAALNT